MHGAPRRIREEVRGLFGDAGRARRLEATLGAIEGVEAARASPRTGRVLVRFREPDPEALASALEALALAATDDAPEPPSLRRVAEEAAGAVRGAWGRVRGKPAALAAELPGEALEPWHARDPVEAARLLDVEPTLGLHDHEAARRLRESGPNMLAGVEPRSRAQILAGQVLTFPVGLLAGAVPISALLGDLLEAGAITLVIGSNIAIGYVVEARMEELLDAWGSLRAEWARVRRDGRELTVRAVDLVPGDVLLVRAGEAIAADARVITARGLALDESTLTGESEPAEKSPAAVTEVAPVADRSSMLFAGTFVAAGRGEAVVVGTGSRTELGSLQRALARTSERTAPLEQQLGDLGRRLGVLCLASSGIVAGVGFLRGRSLRAIAEQAVALGVAAIPEGLPTAGTTALALASRRMFRRGLVIRRLPAAETLGAVSVICADKTGTLTENRMRVTELFLTGEGLVRVRWGDGSALRPGITREDGTAPSPERLRELARIAALNSDVEVDDRGVVHDGSGTERALAELALGIGYPVARRRAGAPRPPPPPAPGPAPPGGGGGAPRPGACARRGARPSTRS